MKSGPRDDDAGKEGNQDGEVGKGWGEEWIFPTV